MTEARIAEVVSDSELSPLEVFKTGLNMLAVLAVSNPSSGTRWPPGEKREQFTVTIGTLRNKELWLRGCQHLHSAILSTLTGGNYTEEGNQ